MTDEKDLPTPPTARTRDQALWVGLFLIVALVVTLVLLFQLTDAAMFRGRYIVTTVMPSAGGLRRGDPVQMRGVNIGRVMGFKIIDKNVEIRLEIQGEYGVPNDSKVELRSLGMLGGMVASIVPGTSATRLRYGDTVQSAPQENVMDQLNVLVDRAGKAMDRVDTLMSDAFVQDIHGSGQETRALLKSLSETVKEQRIEIKTLEASLLRSSQAMEKITSAPELDRAVKRLDTLTANADKLSESMNKSAQTIEDLLGRVQRGEGTMGKLSQDEAMYKNMDETVQSFRQTSKDLSELMLDIKKNPKKYFKFSVF